PRHALLEQLAYGLERAALGVARRGQQVVADVGRRIVGEDALGVLLEPAAVAVEAVDQRALGEAVGGVGVQLRTALDHRERLVELARVRQQLGLDAVGRAERRVELDRAVEQPQRTRAVAGLPLRATGLKRQLGVERKLGLRLAEQPRVGLV